MAIKSKIIPNTLPDVDPLSGGSYLALGAAFFAITCLMTYPLILAPHRNIIGLGGDGLVWAWNLSWTRHALLVDHEIPFFSDHVYRPYGTAFLHFPHTFFYGFIYTLAGWIHPNPVLWSNGFIMATFVITALGTFMLARQVSGHTAGAFVAAVIFAFCTYRLVRVLGHLNILCGEWIPWYLFFLVRAMQTNHRRHYLGMALAFTFSVWNDYYQALFILMFTGVFLASAPWLQLHRGWTIRERFRSAIPGIVVLAVVLAPLVWGIIVTLMTREITPAPGADRYYVTPLNYLLPGAHHRLLRPWLLDFYEHAMPGNPVEASIYLGYTALALALWGAFRSRAKNRFYLYFALCAAVFILFSFGKSLRLYGLGWEIPMPYALFVKIPFFEDFRVPSRFGGMVPLCVGVLAAFGVRAIDRRLHRPWLKIGVPAVLVLLVLLENTHAPWPEYSSAIKPQIEGSQFIETIKNDPVPGAVLNFPVSYNNINAVWYQTYHHRSIVTGIHNRPHPSWENYYDDINLVGWFRPDLQYREAQEDPLAPLWMKDLSRVEALEQWADQAAAWTPEAISRFCHFFDLRFLLIPPHSKETDIAGRLNKSILPLVGEVHQANGWLGILEKQPARFPIEIKTGSRTDGYYFTRHFGPPDGGVRWLVGPRGSITIRLEQPADLRLKIIAHGPSHIEPGKQRVRVRVRGRTLIDTAVNDGWQGWECRIPANLTRAGYNDIWLEAALSISPAELGLSDDTRPLSFVLGNITIDRINQ